MANQNNSKYTTGFIPVKNIVNGMIELDNKKLVTGIKVMPKNIFILEKSTQDAIIDGLRQAYDTIDFEFWLIIADRPVDINSYLSTLQVLFNDSRSQIQKKLIMQDIEKANTFVANNVVDTEFYILFKDKDRDLCQKRIRNLINALARAGLNSKQTSNEDLRVILDNFLNGGSSTTFGAVMG
jgi:hypothetical protein